MSEWIPLEDEHVKRLYFVPGMWCRPESFDDWLHMLKLAHHTGIHHTLAETVLKWDRKHQETWYEDNGLIAVYGGSAEWGMVGPWSGDHDDMKQKIDGVWCVSKLVQADANEFGQQLRARADAWGPPPRDSYMARKVQWSNKPQQWDDEIPF